MKLNFQLRKGSCKQQMAKVELVSFDAADTLIKLARSVGEYYAAIASKYGVICEASLIDQSFKKVFAGSPPLGQDNIKGITWWRNVIEKTFAELGFGKESFTDFEDFISELYEVLVEDSAWVAFADAETLLRQLKEQNMRMIVFSNFDERLNKVLHDLKIDHYFEKVICSTQIGYAKPDSKAFAKVAEIVQLEPQQIMHVGDGFENDYLGALRANMQALFLNRAGLIKHQMANPKCEISSLLNVTQFIP
jgi:putative hydrolase of the HAD superfamily